MKDIKQLITLFIIAGLVLPIGGCFYMVFDAYQSERIFAPAPPMTANDIARAAVWAEAMFYFKIGLLLFVLVTLFALVMRYLIIPARLMQERIPYDPATGMLPLVRRDTAPPWKQVLGHHEYDELDGNLASSPHRKVWSNGRFAVEANNNGLDPVDQARYASGSWAVQRSIANKKGMTVGEARFASGEFNEKAQMYRQRREHQQWRMEEQQRKALPAPVDEVRPVQQPILLREAIEMSSANEWIIGQAIAEQPTSGFAKVGQLSVFRPRNNHAAIVGSTGSGKTASTGLLFAFYARKFGYHPIVLDGKNGIDWEYLNGIVEWHSMDIDSVAWQVEALYRLFAERFELLRSHKAANIDQLPERVTPIIVIIEEFGHIWTSLRNNDKELYQHVGERIDKLFRLARATGITMVLIDQAPERWSAQMRGNARPTCFKLKGGTGNVFNEYHVDKLPDVGVFSQDNVFYRAWHTDKEIQVSDMFPPLGRRLLVRTERTERTNARTAERTVTNPVRDDLLEERTATNGANPDFEGGDKPGKIAIPPSLQRSFVRSFAQNGTGNWAEFWAGMFDIYPDIRQAQMRQIMVDMVDTGQDSAAFKGVAYEMFHRFSPDGDRNKYQRVEV